MHRRIAPAAAVVAAMLVAAPAAAQRAAEVTPFIGLLLPTSAVMARYDAEVKQLPSLAAGVRAALPSRGRLGFEGVLAVASGKARGSAGGTDPEVEARTVMASVRAVWALGGDGAAWHATTGLGVLARGSTAYESLDGTTDIGAVIGIGTRVPVGRWALRLDLEDTISSAEFSSGGASTGSRLQNDLMLGVGLVLPLGRTR